MGYRKSQEVIHNGIYAVLLRTLPELAPDLCLIDTPQRL